MKAVAWMMGALASFSLMAVSGRELTGELGIFQILFFRSLVGLLVMTLIIVISGKTHLFYTTKLKKHMGRNIIHYAGQFGWFLGLGLLPLAEVIALEFTVPVWTALIAAAFLGERLTLKRTIAIAIGLCGVVVIVKPSVALFKPAALLVLGAAVCYAVTHVTTKSLALTDQPMTILFYMCIVQFPIALIMAIPAWEIPNIEQWWWIISVALSALSAHFFLTKAMQNADVGTVVMIDFLRLPLAAALGVLLYNEAFDVALLVGASIMLFSNLINIYKPKKRPV